MAIVPLIIFNIHSPRSLNTHDRSIDQYAKLNVIISDVIHLSHKNMVCN